MWSSRWVRIGAVALGFFLINGLARLISFLIKPEDDPLALEPEFTTAQTAVGVTGMLLVVALLAAAAAYWAARHEAGRVVADLGFATLGGTALASFIGPFLGGGSPFSEGLESFVYVFGQFLGLGALGIFLGFSAMVVLGKDWKSRGLSAYAERYGKHPKAARR